MLQRIHGKFSGKPAHRMEQFRCVFLRKTMMTKGFLTNRTGAWFQQNWKSDAEVELPKGATIKRANLFVDATVCNKTTAAYFCWRQHSGNCNQIK